MSLAERIAPHLPNLRRFARLLTGSQRAGDTAVARLLEAIAADATVFPDLPPRIALYQCFLGAFTTRMEDPAAQAEEIGITAARSLAALPLQARQAFLLVSVEEFERSEAAQVLEVSERRINDLLEQASKEIGRQIATDVLIIEDEPLIAMDLERMLRDLGHRVTSIARTHKDALKAAALQKPGLVLADIRLADGSSGLDAVNDILGELHGAGRVHHRLPGETDDRRAARAHLPHHQAVPGRRRQGDHQPGAVLRPAGQAAHQWPIGPDELRRAVGLLCPKGKRKRNAIAHRVNAIASRVNAIAPR